MFHIFGNLAINRFWWKIQQFSEGHGVLRSLLSFLEFVHSELFCIVKDNPICPAHSQFGKGQYPFFPVKLSCFTEKNKFRQKWFMVRAVHFLLKHQLHNASRDRAKNPSESPDLAFYRDNGEKYLPNHAIIQNILEARSCVIMQSLSFSILCVLPLVLWIFFC